MQHEVKRLEQLLWGCWIPPSTTAQLSLSSFTQPALQYQGNHTVSLRMGRNPSFESLMAHSSFATGNPDSSNSCLLWRTPTDRLEKSF